ncbi:MAG: hypothetical protein ACAI35_28505 [Candidatus Methylacidiphilales bacterium]
MSASHAVHGAPVVDFPAGNVAWTVEITYPKSKAAPSTTPVNPGAAPAQQPQQTQGSDSLPEKVVAIRVGDRTCYTVTYQNKTVVEAWVVGPLLVLEDPQSRSVNVLPADRNVGFGPYDGSLFSWVTENMLASNDPWRGKPAMCYRSVVAQAVTPGTEPSSTPPPATQQVWIDPETRRPLALDDGQRTCVFTFQPGPARLPPIPQYLENALKLYAGSFRTSPIPRGRSR